MAVVYIPSLLRDLTPGQETVQVSGATVAEVIEQLESRYPGIKGRLCVGSDLKPGLAVAVDSQVGRLGLREKVGENSEVHFVPAIAGG